MSRLLILSIAAVSSWAGEQITSVRQAAIRPGVFALEWSSPRVRYPYGLVRPGFPMQPVAAFQAQDDAFLFDTLNELKLRAGQYQEGPNATVRRKKKGAPGGLLSLKIRISTPPSGPSATFGRGGAHEAEITVEFEAELEAKAFRVPQLLANQMAGPWTLTLEAEYVDGQKNIRYHGRGEYKMQNFIPGGMNPGLKKALIGGSLGGAMMVPFYYVYRGTGPRTTVQIGPGRVTTP